MEYYYFWTIFGVFFGNFLKIFYRGILSVIAANFKWNSVLIRPVPQESVGNKMPTCNQLRYVLYCIWFALWFCVYGGWIFSLIIYRTVVIVSRCMQPY